MNGLSFLVCKSRTLAFGILISTLTGSTAFADGIVHQCKLRPDRDFTNAEVRVFEFEGFVHSAYVQFTAEDGNTIPYLFACEINCKMEFVGEEYEYSLIFKHPLSNEATVDLRMSSTVGDFKTTDSFVAHDCEAIVIETD